tara:strand:+ start:586 stop:879 length:294 start_codon:yes stop_codon:yes gene_type:complete
MKFKATVYVKLRQSVSDAAGNAVMRNTKRLAPSLDVSLLRIGKAIDMWFDAPDEETVIKELYDLSDQLLSNTVIEDWSYELVETEEIGLGAVSNPRA